MLVVNDSANGCKQGSFLKRKHVKVFLSIDARNQKSHFDGCPQRCFGKRMRAGYGANPGCAQPTTRCVCVRERQVFRHLTECNTNK